VALVAALAADTPATGRFAPPLRRAAVCRSAAHGSSWPAWFRDECPEAFSPRRLDALLARARCAAGCKRRSPPRSLPSWATRGWTCQQSDLLPAAVKVLAEVDVTQTDSIAQGRVEVQDLGSQLLLEAVGIEPGGRWLDACAGAGGKTLATRPPAGAGGQIDGTRYRAAALTELEERAQKSPYSLYGGL